MLLGGSFNTPAKIQLFRRRMGANTHPIGPSTPFVRHWTCVHELVDACRPDVGGREAWNPSFWKVGWSNHKAVSGIKLTLACSRHERVSMRRNNITICLVLSSAFVFVPWQAAYLWSWLALLYACGTRYVRRPFPGSTPSIAPSPRETSSPPAAVNSPQTKPNVHTEPRYWGIDIEHHNQHILLLMTWLLVLAAPVLTVWIRTLWIAGLTAPFETDYSMLKASPFVILAVFASRTEGSLYARHRSANPFSLVLCLQNLLFRFERLISVRWSFAVLAFVSFFIGPSRAYVIFDAARVCILLVVALRIIPTLCS